MPSPIRSVPPKPNVVSRTHRKHKPLVRQSTHMRWPKSHYRSSSLTFSSTSVLYAQHRVCRRDDAVRKLARRPGARQNPIPALINDSCTRVLAPTRTSVEQMDKGSPSILGRFTGRISPVNHLRKQQRMTTLNQARLVRASPVPLQYHDIPAIQEEQALQSAGSLRSNTKAGQGLCRRWPLKQPSVGPAAGYVA